MSSLQFCLYTSHLFGSKFKNSKSWRVSQFYTQWVSAVGTFKTKKAFFSNIARFFFYYYVVLHSNNAIKDFFGDHESRSFIKRTVIKTAVEKDKVNV